MPAPLDLKGKFETRNPLYEYIKIRMPTPTIIKGQY